MRRREFVVRSAGLTLAWPVAVLAQRSAVSFVGFLNSGSPNERAHLVEAFRQGLKEGGYVDGRDVAVEYRWAEGRNDRLPGLAMELVNRKVAVIVATGGIAPALAAKSATSTIPIVFTGGQDPVKLGLVASLARPGGNATGVLNIAGALNAKRFEILRDAVPTTTRIVYLVDPNVPDAKTAINEIQAAAKATATKIQILNAGTVSEIDAAFGAMKRSRGDALLVANSAFFLSQRDQLVALAARHAIPTSYPFREFTTAGGLLSYGSNVADGYRQAGIYTARILKGAKPADLPVIQAAKFELVLNAKTARALGLKMSRDFLARVDELIE